MKGQRRQGTFGWGRILFLSLQFGCPITCMVANSCKFEVCAAPREDKWLLVEGWDKGSAAPLLLSARSTLPSACLHPASRLLSSFFGLFPSVFHLEPNIISFYYLPLFTFYFIVHLAFFSLYLWRTLPDFYYTTLWQNVFVSYFQDPYKLLLRVAKCAQVRRVSRSVWLGWPL